jgi:hypothetical protein
MGNNSSGSLYGRALAAMLAISTCSWNFCGILRVCILSKICLANLLAPNFLACLDKQYKIALLVVEEQRHTRLLD